MTVNETNNDLIFIKIVNPSDFENINFNIKTKGWRLRTAKAISLFCTINPNYDDIKRVKQIFDLINKKVKQKINENKLCTLIALINISCKSHLIDRFQQDSNCIKKIAVFIENIVNTTNLSLYSFLCTHRGNNKENPNEVVKNIPENYLQNFCYLLINVSNCLAKTKNEIIIFQQFPNKFISCSMFPGMFISYLSNNKINDLFSDIDIHIKQLESLKNNFQKYNIDFKIKDLTSHVQDCLNFLEVRYGKNWLYRKFEKEENTDKLIEIAVKYTLKSMLRFYIENKEDTNIDLKNTCNNPIISESVQVFKYFYGMEISAKALFETTFYYILGNKLIRDDSFYFGFERDHQNYQELALNLGIQEVEPNSNFIQKFLYTRRTKDAKIKNIKGFYNISFRQFWR